MICPNCGQQNPENSAFCTQCGNPLPRVGDQPLQPGQPAPYPEARNQYYPENPYPGSQKPSGSKKGLVIGLSIGGVVLAGLAVALILIFTGGASIVGLWYCEQAGDAIEIRDNGKATVHTYSQDLKGEYEYNPSNGDGVIVVDDIEYDFVVEGGEMDIEGTRTYIRADEDFDLEDFLNEAHPESTPEPSLTPEPLPTPEPTPEPSPTPAIENVSGLNLTLPFAFGNKTGIYTGETMNGLPHGYGSFSSDNAAGIAWTYQGEWENGHFSGQGTTSWDDGFTEGGLYQNDYLNGTGWESWDGVMQYEGEYVDSEFDGQGTLYTSMGEILYSGNFHNGFIQESDEDRAARVGAIKDQCTAYSYQELYDACENGTGVYAQVTGKIFDIYYYPETNPDYCYIYIYNTGGSGNEITGIYYWISEGETPPVMDQTVTVWGSMQYLYSFTATNGSDWTIPQIEAWSVE